MVRVGDDEFKRAVAVTIQTLRQMAVGARSDDEALITYRRLSDLLAAEGLLVPYHEGLLPRILAEASLCEHAKRRGMISALVVKQGGSGPGRGFYRLARRPPFNRSGDETSVWLAEVKRVCAENSPTATEAQA